MLDITFELLLNGFIILEDVIVIFANLVSHLQFVAQQDHVDTTTILCVLAILLVCLLWLACRQQQRNPDVPRPDDDRQNLPNEALLNEAHNDPQHRVIEVAAHEPDNNAQGAENDEHNSSNESDALSDEHISNRAV